MATRSTQGKFTRPRHAGALLRHRLFKAMDAARRHPAVWVAGPPGSGKTTMVSTWLAERGLDSLWYRVHQEDGDPATFFHYFGRAVARKTSSSGPRRSSPNRSWTL